MLKRAAQGGGWVTIPGSVQEMNRYCTKRHGLVAKYWWLDWLILEIFSKFGDSMKMCSILQ